MQPSSSTPTLPTLAPNGGPGTDPAALADTFFFGGNPPKGLFRATPTVELVFRGGIPKDGGPVVVLGVAGFWSNGLVVPNDALLIGIVLPLLSSSSEASGNEPPASRFTDVASPCPRTRLFSPFDGPPNFDELPGPSRFVVVVGAPPPPHLLFVSFFGLGRKSELESDPNVGGASFFGVDAATSADVVPKGPFFGGIHPFWGLIPLFGGKGGKPVFLLDGGLGNSGEGKLVFFFLLFFISTDLAKGEGPTPVVIPFGGRPEENPAFFVAVPNGIPLFLVDTLFTRSSLRFASSSCFLVVKIGWDIVRNGDEIDDVGMVFGLVLLLVFFFLLFCGVLGDSFPGGATL